MQQQPSLHNLLRQACEPESAGYQAPPLTKIKARGRVHPMHSGTGDLIGALARFLNLRVKLYHAVIVFVVVWLAIFLYSSEEETPVTRDVREYPASNLAAAQNHTAPACIKTYLIKK